MRKLIIFILLLSLCYPSEAKRVDEMDRLTSPDITSDLIYTQDVSDTSENSHGTGKGMNIKNLLKAAKINVDGTNVGINTVNPTQQLEVFGTIKATSFIGDGSGLSGVSGSGTECSTSSCDLNSSTTINGNQICQSNGTNCSTGTSGWVDGDSIVYPISTSDNVGIGTIAPIEKLDIDGNLNLSGIFYNNNTEEYSYINSTPYEGLVATRGMLAVAKSTNTMLMSRSVHFSRKNIDSLKIAIPNWWVMDYPDLIEQGTGGTATVTASIEYPAGTFTQVTFDGNSTGTIPDKKTLFSDYVNVSIPDNTQFWVRIFFQGSSVVFVSNNATSSLGSGIETGTSGITDKTMSGTVTASSNHFPPIAIIGWTTEPSVAILGDSKAQGVNDTTADSSGDFGNVARSIGPNYAYMNLAKGGDRANKFIVTSNDTYLRRQLLKYVTHVISAYGYNDAGDDSATVLKNNLNSIWEYCSLLKKKVYQITLGPSGSSSDQFRTTTNQTPWEPNTTTKATVNDWIRTKPYSLTDYFEVADAVSSGHNSGKWIVNGTAFYSTGDGAHESTTGYLLIRDSGAIPSDFATQNIYSNKLNIGIGTINPIQKLEVVGTVKATAFVGDGSGLTGISGGGSVTINTTSPMTGAGSGTSFTLGVDQSKLTLSSIGGAVTDAQVPNNITVDLATAATALAVNPSPCSSGDFVSDIDANGTLTCGTPSGGGGGVGVGTVNPGTVGALTKYVASTTVDDSPVIFEGGSNIGIGTTGPTQKLEVSGTVKATAFTGDGSGLTGVSTGWTDGGANVYLTATTDSVGIGTTGASGSLEIVKQGSTPPLMVSSTATGDGDYLIVRSNGNVGIGTVVPNGLLSVTAPTTNILRLTSTLTSGSGSGAGIQASNDDNAAVVLGDRLAFYTFGGSADTADTILNGGAVTGYADGTWSATSAPTEVRIEVAPSGSTTRAVALVADSTSNIGIGTTTPQTKLQVVGAVTATSFSGDGSALTGISAGGWVDGGTNVYTTTTTDAVAIGTTTPVSGSILTVNGTIAGGGSGPMAITNANVGIGTTTAGSLLTVGSTGQFTVDTSGNTRVGIGTTTAGTIVCVKSISGSTAQLGYCTGSLTNSICGTCN